MSQQERADEKFSTISFLYGLAKAIDTELVTERLLKTVLDDISARFGARRCSILLLNDDVGDVLVEGDTTRTQYSTVVLTRRGAVTEHVLETGQPLLVTAGDETQALSVAPREDYSSDSFVSLPLRIGDRVVAILNVADKADGSAFSEEDCKLLEIVSAQLALKLQAHLDQVLDTLLSALENRRPIMTGSRADAPSASSPSDRERTLATRQAAHLSVLYKIGQAAKSSRFAMEEVARLIARLVGDVSHSTRASVLILGPDGEDQLVRLNHERGDFETIEVAQRGEVTKRVIAERKPLLARDVDPELLSREQGKYATQSFVAVPIELQGEIVGVINVTDKSTGEDFAKEDLRFLELVAAQVAASIENFRLREAAERQRLIERDLTIARDIQSSFLPRQLPRLPGIDLGATTRPARFVGGDYYDLFRLDENLIGVAVADISGKGVPAALLMAMFCTVLRGLYSAGTSTEQVLIAANEYLLEHTNPETFVTAFYGVINTAGRELSYTNAGQCPPVLRRGQTHELELLPPSGPALGVVPAADFETVTTSLGQGDALLLYTDGLTDTMAPDGDLLGTDRVHDMMSAAQATSAQQLIDEILVGVSQWQQGTDQIDDITLVAATVESDATRA